MSDVKAPRDYYFYLWQNHVGNTCFGITSDYNNRRRNYEGHTGVPIEFKALWMGPETLVRDLEIKVKSNYHDVLFATSAGKYEWIMNEIPYEEVEGFVSWETENTYRSLIKKIK